MATPHLRLVVDEDTRTPEPQRTGKLRLYLRRFARNRLALIGVAILGLLILTTLLAPLLTPWDYDDPDFMNLSTGPSPEHWFGTTDAGNDLFAQTVHGLGRSLTIALLVATGTTVIAALVGTGAALYGGRAERILIELIHLLLAVPTFLFIALIVGDSGGDWKVLTLVLILFGWMMSARVIWSMALSVRENDYVRAAHYMGVSRPRIVVRHLIPNIGSLLVIQFTLGVVATIASETGLSFLGLGVKLPDVSLGTLLQTGAGSLTAAPWQFWFPAATLTLLTVSIAFISDGLRDALDPNSAAGGHA
ncbi:MAG: ABC transporter permease [Corynebacterium sp.]|uniref:ABC transporter permease n=1 Tax=unclassified Corynebacterium TaxID=2624378 RepID=UPI002649FFD9|nr:ABC transporter permease [Corynebacterium sp.]MDN5720752.1 ABC transporter permease [Corynebacterium sp.]MDN6258508.1 ABC transporter permease [Corynebacterium sp.]MDN6324433.1 ABC transporter permease [Corynebacterium sp.]MDN6386326.1 ABC transporter permease [Corynebacterium sp.]MDN6509579.1 ABC transporter permease [Corynebacterium sp.]